MGPNVAAVVFCERAKALDLILSTDITDLLTDGDRPLKVLVCLGTLGICSIPPRPWIQAYFEYLSNRNTLIC